MISRSVFIPIGASVFRRPIHTRTLSTMMIVTRTMMTMLRTALSIMFLARYIWTFMMPATKVVTDTKAQGTAVTRA